MKEIRIYVEGGGARGGRTDLRKALRSFLREISQLARIRHAELEIIACKGRGKTWSDFSKARTLHIRALNILLVDSEGPVQHDVWEYLRRPSDGWATRRDQDSCYHLMVQTMEAWLLADEENLAAYYGDGFNGNPLPDRANVEDIPKAELEPALDAAARHTKKGGYRKGRDSFALLATTDPNSVQAAARHCKRLFQFLRAALNEE